MNHDVINSFRCGENKSVFKNSSCSRVHHAKQSWMLHYRFKYLNHLSWLGLDLGLCCDVMNRKVNLLPHDIFCFCFFLITRSVAFEVEFLMKIVKTILRI